MDDRDVSYVVRVGDGDGGVRYSVYGKKMYYIRLSSVWERACYSRVLGILSEFINITTRVKIYAAYLIKKVVEETGGRGHVRNVALTVAYVILNNMFPEKKRLFLRKYRFNAIGHLMRYGLNKYVVYGEDHYWEAVFRTVNSVVARLGVVEDIYGVVMWLFMRLRMMGLKPRHSPQLVAAALVRLSCLLTGYDYLVTLDDLSRETGYTTTSISDVAREIGLDLGIHVVLTHYNVPEEIVLDSEYSDLVKLVAGEL